MTHFRICSFRHDKDRPVSYKKYKDLLLLEQEIRRIVTKTDCDYVSLRIIRTPKDTKQEQLE